MQYVSTRDAQRTYSAAQAIVQGLAQDGGLLTPVSLPRLPETALKEMTAMSYQQRAVYVMQLFLEDFSREELTAFAAAAYGPAKFDTPEVTPVRTEHPLPGAVARAHLRLQGSGPSDAAPPADRLVEKDGGGEDGVHSGGHLRRHGEGGS